jgi:Zn-dependent protease with chaperone function
MSSAVLLCLVLLATFGLASLVLSGALLLVWRAGLARASAASLDLLSLRLLPAGGALLIALAVVLPAFLSFEPHREHEGGGPLLLVLAALAALFLAHGTWRGWRACRAAYEFLSHCRLSEPSGSEHGPAAHLVDVAEPLVAVIGAWRPRIVAAESVRAACSGEEFRAVLAHEAAHLAVWDNLKLLLLVAAPDALAWTPLAATLTARWRGAAEGEADQRATGDDSQLRLALASALIKVARLVSSGNPPHPPLGMAVATDDVAGRVRALLRPRARPLRATTAPALAGAALLIPLLALPRYALLHRLIEQLVGLGR